MDLTLNIGLQFMIVICSTIVVITLITTKFRKREE